MASAEFDAHADSYQEAVERSIAFAGQELEFFTRTKAEHLLAVAERHLGPPAGLRMLDVGCGVGTTDRFLGGVVGELHGVDTSAEAIERARRTNPGVDYRAYAGERLPYRDQSFDVAFAICVVHHVPVAQWHAFASEMARVLRPRGIAAIFEHNPHNPLTRRVVSNCVFDEDAVLLRRRRAAGLLRSTGLERCEDRYIAFLPFGGRAVAPVERALGRVPLGAQYYVSASKR
jgi:SAM-dependent methyltransferase